MSIANEKHFKMKICKACKIEKPHTMYYIAVKDKYNRLHPRCKPCHSEFAKTFRKAKPKPQKIKKLQGFAALSDEVRSDIILMIDNKEKFKIIAKKHDIPYSTLLGWNSSGRIIENNNILNI